MSSPKKVESSVSGRITAQMLNEEMLNEQIKICIFFLFFDVKDVLSNGDLAG